MLARTGLGSRRHMEELIRNGRVQVDGKTAELGQKVSGQERIVVDGKPVQLKTAETSVAEVLLALTDR